MTASPVERLVSAFASYAISALPGLLTQANIGQAVAAPAFRKIEKTAVLKPQYFPMAAINLDGAVFSDAANGAILAEASVDIIAAAADSQAERLAVVLDRYLDTIVDLASTEARAAAVGFEVKVVTADKGVEPDGTRGWVAVSFTVWGEAPF